MLDDYSLRLLAEIGIEIDPLPRSVARPAGSAGASAQPAQQTATAAAAPAPAQADIGIVCATASRAKLVGDLGKALRSARIRSALIGIDAADVIATMRGVLVLGEALARRLGAQLPAQRQTAIEWVIVGEPDELARNPHAKRALWGEIKRLSRSLAPHHDGASRH